LKNKEEDKQKIKGIQAMNRQKSALKNFRIYLTAGIMGGLALSFAPSVINGFSSVAHAEDDMSHNGVKQFVQQAANEVIQVLNMPDRSLPTRQKAFQEIFTRYADVPRIAAFAGGSGWKDASPKQRDAFVEVFGRYMAFTYAKRFESYAGETVDITRVTDAGRKGLIIQTKINRPAGAPPVLVDWQIKAENESYKVVDLVVEQVSMSMTQRAEFQAILEKNNNSLEALRDNLTKRL
jgi:phospholipid transport system substrate-binding protein